MIFSQPDISFNSKSEFNFYIQCGLEQSIRFKIEELKLSDH